MDKILNHQENLFKNVTIVQDMVGSPIVGNPIKSKIILIGQALGLEGNCKDHLHGLLGKIYLNGFLDRRW